MLDASLLRGSWRERRAGLRGAISRPDTVDGWRDRRQGGGVAVDVRTGEIVCEGLSHAAFARRHAGVLWVLNAGSGELGVVARASSANGRFEPRVFCPGFLRGLALHDGLQFLGLSKPQYERFEGLPLDERLRRTDSSPWCGIQVIDLAVIPGFVCPTAVIPGSPEAAAVITHLDWSSR